MHITARNGVSLWRQFWPKSDAQDVEFCFELEDGYSIHTLDTRSWAEGMYFVKYVYRDPEKIEKVVISR